MNPAVQENARLAALARYGILDTIAEDAFDELVRLAADICRTPIALISLVDETRQWFKARVGLDASETSRAVSFCAHAIEHDELFIIEDATLDPRFAGNPLVTGEPHIRFYAGAPLITPAGVRLGTLCVIDRVPRVLDEFQCASLRALARQVVVQLELRRHIAERDEVEKMKSEFVSTVSHELRTPLTSIRGSLGLLAAGVMGELPSAAHELVAVAERNSLRLISLINDILDFERFESGSAAIDLRPTPLARVFARSLETISAFAAQEGIDIELLHTDEVVAGDEERLTQVMVNLLSNAVKYSHRGGVITVGVWPRIDAVEVRVEDRGIGIAFEAQEKLFRRFQQVDASDARRKPGTGLGLAICKAIIDRHGGTIGVDSREGEGSTFWFRIPA